MRVVPYAFAIVLVLGVVVSKSSSDEDVRLPVKVAVQHNGEVSRGVALPVEFMAPLHNSDAGSPFTSFLVSTDGLRALCQVEPFKQDAVDTDYTWARLTSLLPPGDAVYFLETGGVALPEDVKAVSSIVSPDRVLLDIGAIKATFDPMRFHILESVTLFGRPMVPEYVEGLVNRQQGLTVDVTDVIRHVDHTLSPESECLFAAERAGPVLGGVSYAGRLSGEGDFEPVSYQSRVWLLANGIIGIEVRLDVTSLDPERFTVSAVRMTLPIILERASSLSFGAGAITGSSRPHWEGKASLSLNEDGSYRLADADGSVVTGRGPVKWASYSDSRQGLGMVWDGAGREMELSIDFNEDLIEFAAVPQRGDDGTAVVRLYILPHGAKSAGDMLNSIAESLAHPPTATVSDAYVRAMTHVE